LLLARLLRDGGDHDRSTTLLHQAWLRHPSDFWITYDLAWQHFYSTPPRFDGLRQYATAAVAIRPNSAIAHYALGCALCERGDPDAGIAQYREALRIKPDLQYRWAPRKLYVVLKEQGKQGQAIEEFRDAARRQPDQAWAHLNLGWVLIDAGRFDDALASYRKAVEIAPDAVSRDSRTDAFKRLLKADAIPIHPDDPSREVPSLRDKARAFYAFAKTYSACTVSWPVDQVDGATAAYRRVVGLSRRVMEFEAGSPDALGALGNALAALGEHLLSWERWSEAESTLRECLALRKRHPVVAWPRYFTASALGEALFHLGRFDEAEPLVLSGYEGLKARKSSLGKGNEPYFVATTRRVVQLYEAWNRPDKAAEWRAKLEAQEAP
jgi:tetratricopeptide (TPR) repeat protein